MLKLFRVDLGWGGSVLVAADTAEEALALVKVDLPISAKDSDISDVAEVPFERGVIHVAHQRQH